MTLYIRAHVGTDGAIGCGTDGVIAYGTDGVIGYKVIGTIPCEAENSSTRQHVQIQAYLLVCL